MNNSSNNNNNNTSFDFVNDYTNAGNNENLLHTSEKKNGLPN